MTCHMHVRIDILAFVSIPTKSMSAVPHQRVRMSPTPDSDTCKSPSSGPFLLAFSQVFLAGIERRSAKSAVVVDNDVDDDDDASAGQERKRETSEGRGQPSQS